MRLASLVRELLKIGHEVEIVTAFPNYPNGSIFAEYRGRIYQREQWEGATVHRVWLYASVGAGARRILNYLSFTLMCFVGLLKCRKADCIFVESPPLFLAIPGFLISRLRRATFIFNVADLWPDSVQQLSLMQDGILLRSARALERWSYRHADCVNAVTDRMKTILVQEKGLPPEKLLFLPNGVDTEMFCERPPDIHLAEALGLKGKSIVLYAGNHGYIAGLETALHAAKLVEHFSNIHFLFVGGGSEKRRLLKLASELDLKNATFLDPVPVEELPRFMSIASCCLVTLRDCCLSEIARPAKTFVMMASGKAIVLSAAGESTQIIRDAEAGIVVPPGDPAAIADAIVRLMSDSELAATLGSNARNYVEHNFRWHDLISGWLAELQRRSQKQGPSLASKLCNAPSAVRQDSVPGTK